MRITPDSIPGLKVTVMGLGLHGGGLASTRFFADHGAQVTVTDLRDEETLQPTLDQLSDYNIRYVLEHHDTNDFKDADVVIKNPAVRSDSPYLQAAKRIETDISVFLQLHDGPVYGVTGTKGKSTTASAMYHIQRAAGRPVFLGGNITVSPLEFFAEATGALVVLELSSWQLADLRGRGVLRPQVAAITNILRDHQNHYESMESYIADKMVLFESQTAGQTAISNFDDPLLQSIGTRNNVNQLYFSRSVLPDSANGAYLRGERGFLRIEGAESEILNRTQLKGEHNRLNLLCAAMACAADGLAAETVQTGAATFAGVEHRLEYVTIHKGIEFYNDSAATIPDATIAAARAFRNDLLLICGGTDKELDFADFSILGDLTKEIYLLEGSATTKMMAVFESAGISYNGPFPSLENCIRDIMLKAESGDVVLLSPGCASFGMFLNEFHRGRSFKEIVQELSS